MQTTTRNFHLNRLPFLVPGTDYLSRSMPCDGITGHQEIEWVYTEFPFKVWFPVTGEHCEPGLSCRYDYALLPTILDGDSCQDPFTCAPKNDYVM